MQFKKEDPKEYVDIECVPDEEMRRAVVVAAVPSRDLVSASASAVPFWPVTRYVVKSSAQRSSS